jgi:branched-subunit amino acid aminotransferase/4-amino-4-deoxychorismate lyase
MKKCTGSVTDELRAAEESGRPTVCAGQVPVAAAHEKVRPLRHESVTADARIGAVHESSRADPAKGIFETLLVAGGRAIELDAHVRRFRRSLSALYGVDAGPELEDEIARESSRHDTPARLRVIFAPGSADPFVLDASSAPDSLLSVQAHEPLDARLLTLPGGLGAHKWCDRTLLESPGERRVPILCDADGLVLEAGHANVVLVEANRIATSPLDGRILPGVTRARVLELARAAGIAVAEESLSLERLGRADDVFLTSSIRGVQRVGRCDGAGAWAQSRVSELLARELRAVWRRAPSRAPRSSRAPAP